MAGRRPGAPDTRGEIVVAARAELAQRGYDGTSIRAVARRARVDPALVHHYFKDKQRLVRAALALPVDPVVALGPVLVASTDDAGSAFVRAMLTAWDDPANREAVVAMARSGLGSADQGAIVRDAILDGPVRELLRRHRPDAPPAVPALLLAEMVGLVAARYLLEVEPLATMTVDELVAVVGPTVQSYLGLDALATSPARDHSA
ncbi:TetR family transcriptional regulator [Mumia sp. zg.B53]|uniref:TetR/AcrR family transcriptional regulator n=1 Tax=unclassified Mumia TaxID=2621872 RepID=UPI001C6E6D34|nr:MULTISPECIES: TetR family transcriptional regulator [unclassified Mumia]MBW9204524.1 TetR family transcriptional regulator [Mumia sp. zg.B17]MBW9209472.1 TetR family transcriptional regulator [Mumia sp. zg.B21]MBW9214077.1 TetR family transcriptional regulator [Mumia sp. zg.B53]MDD9348639.1 TetR family transcriptional regulator [Mumia sp.]